MRASVLILFVCLCLALIVAEESVPNKPNPPEAFLALIYVIDEHGVVHSSENAFYAIDSVAKRMAFKTNDLRLFTDCGDKNNVTSIAVDNNGVCTSLCFQGEECLEHGCKCVDDISPWSKLPTAEYIGVCPDFPDGLFWIDPNVQELNKPFEFCFEGDRPIYVSSWGKQRVDRNDDSKGSQILKEQMIFTDINPGLPDERAFEVPSDCECPPWIKKKERKRVASRRRRPKPQEDLL
eukprot:TRINITY_DN4009_c0_g1_i1.p1 TRINITY_DN4009_c0_g1~~TRINITY_DN4009_c0_g1_i1.p1  ORF type:complete len:236 (+),score=31.36 TRINITY_DN4009_c0_g1_i1:44-751(+)